jgi:UDP-glucose 4-epimerase
MPVSLVTGGAGFLGSHVSECLLRMGHEVVILDDLSGGFLINVPDGATFVNGSIVDRGLVQLLFRRYQFEYVYHLAAYAAEGLSHFIKRFNYENNLVGSVTLVNEAVNHGTKCFVFASSIAVYGAGQVPLTEDMVPIPEDPYGIAKLAVEQELRVSRQMFGLEYIIFRPHNVYGERQHIGDRYRNVIGIFMNQLLNGRPMTIFGDGSQQRAFTHVSDVAPIIAESVLYDAARCNIFNIGSDKPYTVNEVAHLVAHSLGEQCRIEYLAPRYEVQIAFSSHLKAGSVFGFKDKVMLPDGVDRMARWVKQHGASEPHAFDDIEIKKNMPPAWISS